RSCRALVRSAACSRPAFRIHIRPRVADATVPALTEAKTMLLPKAPVGMSWATASITPSVKSTEADQPEIASYQGFTKHTTMNPAHSVSSTVTGQGHTATPASAVSAMSDPEAINDRPIPAQAQRRENKIAAQ